ncbi:hypothetical protein LQV63_15365 [Paenibacillus profundus]|uniref:Uncharacterized protein n=1 Tax=Paenibacillus profundus TaxID=1173085 RepID=A0ABS8YKB1_9BACL|nr:hypothetical protein [Paenibacillus profundus]MCE5170692.1 hypothetical protein [Paenibacillus profundus]
MTAAQAVMLFNDGVEVLYKNNLLIFHNNTFRSILLHYFVYAGKTTCPAFKARACWVSVHDIKNNKH